MHEQGKRDRREPNPARDGRRGAGNRPAPSRRRARGRATRGPRTCRPHRGLCLDPSLEECVLRGRATGSRLDGLPHRPYHPPTLHTSRSTLGATSSLAFAAALALALCSCATSPVATSPAATVPSPAPVSAAERPAPPEEALTAAEIAVEPMPAILPPELPGRSPPGETRTRSPTRHCSCARNTAICGRGSGWGSCSVISTCRW